MHIPAIRVTLADGSYVDCSTADPYYLKLYGSLQSFSSGVPKMIYVGCVLCHVLPNVTSDVVLAMDWLHAISPWTDKSAYSLSLDCRGHSVHILGTK